MASLAVKAVEGRWSCRAVQALIEFALDDPSILMGSARYEGSLGTI